MGEIGYNRQEYLYDLSYCDILCIERGYYRRNREMWSATRWQTYYIMLAQCGNENLRKNRIYKPADLIQFPWEKEKVEVQQASEGDVRELQAIMDAMSEEILAKAKQNKQSGT